jgi:hypothetical protein
MLALPWRLGVVQKTTFFPSIHRNTMFFAFSREKTTRKIIIIGCWALWNQRHVDSLLRVKILVCCQHSAGMLKFFQGKLSYDYAWSKTKPKGRNAAIARHFKSDPFFSCK